MTATPRTGPLAGIRVVDISTVMAGPFATHLLADQGADVVKIEPLDGDIMRHSGPAPAPGMSPNRLLRTLCPIATNLLRTNRNLWSW